MFDQIREKYSEFLKRSPGERFIREYESRNELRKKQSGWKSKAYIAFAVLLILIGAFIGIFPGVPGLLLLLIGFLIIAARSSVAAKILDYFDLLVDIIRKKMK